MSRLWAGMFGLVLMGSLIMNFVGPHKEYAEYLWDVKLFFAIYGLLGCFLLIGVSKGLANYLLLRDSSYYEPYRAPAEVGQAGTPATNGGQEVDDDA